MPTDHADYLSTLLIMHGEPTIDPVATNALPIRSSGAYCKRISAYTDRSPAIELHQNNVAHSTPTCVYASLSPVYTMKPVVKPVVKPV